MFFDFSSRRRSIVEVLGALKLAFNQVTGLLKACEVIDFLLMLGNVRLLRPPMVYDGDPGSTLVMTHDHYGTSQPFHAVELVQDLTFFSLIRSSVPWI